MKLFRKRSKKNNRGFSLVELVCVVAILGLTTTAVGSAMVVSAQNYKKGTVEFDVQQEVQTTTNLIGNLVVDAVNAEVDPSGKLTVEGNNLTYTIERTADNELKYCELSGSPLAVTASGILAENVTSFSVDTSTFNANKNVKVNLTVEKDGKKYETSYNTTARNGEVSSIAGSAVEPTMIVDNQVVIEPGQEIFLPVTWKNMTTDQAIALTGDLIYTISVADKDKFETWSTSNSGVTMKLKDDASGDVGFVINTTNKKADGTTPIATSAVTVYIRRVNNMDVNVTNTGIEYKAGTVYRVSATVAGTHLEKMSNVSGVLPTDGDYIKPYYVDFDYEITPSVFESQVEVVSINENSDNPYIEFRLKSDMLVGSKIKVVATAKHPDGEMVDESGVYYNKASVQNDTDDPYASIVKMIEIKKSLNGPWPNGSGLKRNDDQFWINATDEIKAKMNIYNTDAYGRANKYEKAMRYWKATDPAPADDSIGWQIMNTTGDSEVKFNIQQASVFDPHTEYVVELRLRFLTSEGVVKWPEAGTPREEYISTFVMEPSSINYKIGTGLYNRNLGTEATPITVKNNDVIDVKTSKINFKNIKDRCEYRFEKMVKTIKPDGTVEVSWNPVASCPVQLINKFTNDGNGGTLQFAGIEDSDVGIYMVKVYLDYEKGVYDPTVANPDDAWSLRTIQDVDMGSTWYLNLVK